MAEASQETQAALLSLIMHDPAIIATAIVVEFILMLAITLSIVPMAWWLRADHLLGVEPNASTTPLRWLEKKIQRILRQPDQTAEQAPVSAPGEQIIDPQTGQPVVNPASVGLPTTPGQAVTDQPVPGQPTPGQPAPGQPTPGQPVAGQAQPLPGQPATVTEVKPGETAAPGTPGTPGTPGAPVAPPPASPLDALNMEEQPTDDPLADIANIKDILSAAFDEDIGIDPEREALGRSLDDLDIVTVRTTARQILATFKQ